MSELIFINTPGSNNITFSLNSDSINLDLAKAIYGNSYRLPVFVVNFRFCRPGEYISQNKWLSWSENSYSFDWNSTQWNQWMGNAFWEGDEIVKVDSGYWRKSTNSTLIIQWPNKDAWSGGYNNTSINPVNCEAGYKDILWSKWTKVDNDNYEKTSNFQCSKWPAIFVIYLRMFGSWALFIFIIVFIIYMKRKEGNERTILMRIMTNYIQIMTTTLSYNLDFPKVVSDLFSPLKNYWNWDNISILNRLILFFISGYSIYSFSNYLQNVYDCYNPNTFMSSYIYNFRDNCIYC